MNTNIKSQTQNKKLLMCYDKICNPAPIFHCRHPAVVLYRESRVGTL